MIGKQENRKFVQEDRKNRSFIFNRNLSPTMIHILCKFGECAWIHSSCRVDKVLQTNRQTDWGSMVRAMGRVKMSLASEFNTSLTSWPLESLAKQLH